MCRENYAKYKQMKCMQLHHTKALVHIHYFNIKIKAYLKKKSQESYFQTALKNATEK